MGLKEKQNIPEGWEIKALGDVCHIINGSTPSTSKTTLWNGTINWYTPNDLKYHKINLVESERKISYDGLISIGSRVVPAHSIILSTRAPIGYLGITNTEASFNQGCKGLIPKSDISEKFLYYFLLSNKKSLNGLGSGSTFLELSTSSLSSFLMATPPLKEQQKIAGILEAVDVEIEKTKAVIKATEKLKKGLMQELFTRGIGHSKFKQTELGEIPESWEVVSFKDVLSFTTGKLNSNAAVENGSYPFFTCSQETFQTNTFAFDQEALLLAGNNAAGKYSVKHFKGKFDAYQRTYVISVLDESQLNYLFFKEVLQEKLKELKNSSFGSTTKFLTLKLLESLKMKLPPIDEQKKIACVSVAFDEKIAVNKKLLAKQTELKKGLMQDLLSGVKRVKI